MDLESNRHKLIAVTIISEELKTHRKSKKVEVFFDILACDVSNAQSTSPELTSAACCVGTNSAGFGDVHRSEEFGVCRMNSNQSIEIRLFGAHQNHSGISLDHFTGIRVTDRSR